MSTYLHLFSLTIRAALALLFFGSLTAHAATFYVAPTGKDTNLGTATVPWLTIQRAANVVNPGDTVVVQPGTYKGAKFSRSGLATAYIRFFGQPGALVNSPGPLNSNGDNLWIRNAHYILLEGFTVTNAPRSGIAVQGEPTAPATGNIVRRNHCHHNGRWGIFTGYALNVRIDNNKTSYSTAEHGIYVSNSADNPYIRWNRAHHNRASGIQINADPALAGDGIISGAVVSRNIVHENGAGGGAAINLASVRNSLISNNLLYNNHASGIAGWDDGVGNTFGTQGNRFFNNTVVQASDGRFALVLIHGSINNQVKNNILIHTGTRGSIEIDSSSRPGLVSDYNVVNNRFALNETFITLAQWRAYGYDLHSLVNPGLTTLFVNPTAANYHLRTGSPAINTGVTVTGVVDDIDGTPRPQGPRYDIGADEVLVP